MSDLHLALASACTCPQVFSSCDVLGLFLCSLLGFYTSLGSSENIFAISGAGWLAGWLAGCFAGWLAGCLSGWLAGRFAGWPAGCFAGWLAGCFAGWLAGWIIKFHIMFFTIIL